MCSCHENSDFNIHTNLLTDHCKTVLDRTKFKDKSPKDVDYKEK